MGPEASGPGRRRLGVALVVSLAVHVLLVAGISFVRLPVVRESVRRGEALMVELQSPEEQAPRGNPALRESRPPGAPPSPPARSPRVERPREARRAPLTAAPRTEPVPPSAAPRVDRPALERPRVASAPSVPAPPPPAPSVPVPVPGEDRREQSAKPPEPPARPGPEPRTESRPAAPAARETSTPSHPETSGQEPRVARAPRIDGGSPGGGRATAPDIRSALRASPGGGAAGGRGDGRGGIEGEPVPLDSIDPRYNDYLDRVRRMIKQKWGYPCVRDPLTRECDYKTAQLRIEFGILKDGRVPFVNVIRSSGYAVMDEYAVNAIKLAAPFPPVPDAMSRKGFPILATFNYISETSLVNILR